VHERSYNQYCGVARALDLVGDRWALLVVRDLLLGPKRYTDLARTLPGIGTNILSARLRSLQDAGVIRQRTLPPPAASTVYELTDYGRELEEIVLALGRWGARSMGERRPEQAIHPEWLMNALRAFAAPAGEGTAEEFGLELDGSLFHLRAANGTLEAAPGPADDPVLVLATDTETLLGLVLGAADPEEAGQVGRLRLAGDRAALPRFLGLFSFPTMRGRAAETATEQRPVREMNQGA
jgi:DNA-binding HxlR family transcriptional regulator